MTEQIVVRMKFGSPLYGTSLPTSDTDYKAIHIPSASDILIGRAKETIVTSTKSDAASRNAADDTDFESFSLRQYMYLLLQGQTVALDMFFAPGDMIEEQSFIWEIIKKNKHLWLHKGISAFAGYCKQQANKYGIRGSRIATCRDVIRALDSFSYKDSVRLKEIWPCLMETLSGTEHIVFMTEGMNGHAGKPVRMMDVCGKKVQENIKISEAIGIYRKVIDAYGERALQAERNEGVDWKALMHAVRVCGQAQELLATAHITFPRPDAAKLVRIRKGELLYKEVAEMIEDGLATLETAKAASALRETPDHATADSLVLDWYASTVEAWRS